MGGALVRTYLLIFVTFTHTSFQLLSAFRERKVPPRPRKRGEVLHLSGASTGIGYGYSAGEVDQNPKP